VYALYFFEWKSKQHKVQVKLNAMYLLQKSLENKDLNQDGGALLQLAEEQLP